jgi:proteasome-associated ATPase
MPQRPESPFAEILMATGEGAPSIEDKVRLIEDLPPSIRKAAITSLFAHVKRTSDSLLEAQANQQKLRDVLEKLGAPPWHPAIFRRVVRTASGPQALVSHGNTRRVVALADEVNLESLSAGDEVFLGNELNVIVAKADYGAEQCGEIATFDRCLADGNGRAVLKYREEEIVVYLTPRLKAEELKRGDLIRWDRNTWMAFEKLERAEGEKFFLRDVPNVTRDQVGGQKANLEKLLWVMTAFLLYPEKAVKYGIKSGKNTILMVGPPGCGKTLMARVAAREISVHSGKQCVIVVVKPGQWKNPFVGIWEQNISDTFDALREAAKNGFVVLFLDEIESFGRIRGDLVGHHSDAALATLLTELDGFADRSNVAIIVATNRKDLVDPALLERVSDIEITVGRPDAKGAREIFQIHLPPTLCYSSNGSSPVETRDRMIETAASRFYSPNGDNELCVLRFRDGTTRTVVARQLASGRTFEQICRAACQAALLREVSGGESGLSVSDIEEAVAEAMERLSTTLTPRNVYAYLSDLPQDIDVVSVEPVRRKVTRPHHYLSLTQNGN